MLLAETNEGYHNLIKLVSAGYTEGFYYKPRIDKELLAQHAKGLIGLSSCLKGEVADRHSHRAGSSKAIAAAAAYRDILGAEQLLPRDAVSGHRRAADRQQRPAADRAATSGCRSSCTNDVHYLQNADFTAARHPAVHRHRQDGQRRQAAALPRRSVLPEDRRGDGGGLHGLSRTRSPNTVRIAERCNVDLSYGRELPAELRRAGRLHARRLLRAHRRARASRSGCRGCSELGAGGTLRHTIDEYERRLAYEIDDDQADEVPGYFLIVWDFIRYAREQGIPVGPGRGSAAGSLVAYCLRITDVDPLDYDLIFERFLNPERVSLPDIDIDFCERRRGEVIEYVTRKYGRENVAQIITFGTMKAKAVVRDVGRVLDMPFADVDKVAKLIPPALDMTLDKALEESPVAARRWSRTTRRSRSCSRVARRLEGMTRHASVHAAGVVIAPQAAHRVRAALQEADATKSSRSGR